MGISQVIYHNWRHTLLLLFSDNSCALKNMTLQILKFLTALFKNGLKEVLEQKVYNVCSARQAFHFCSFSSLS